jgi:hypothetical protein
VRGICVIGFISDIRAIRDWGKLDLSGILGVLGIAGLVRMLWVLVILGTLGDSMPTTLSVLLGILRKFLGYVGY